MYSYSLFCFLFMKSIVQLTVIIATYNADKSLSKALDSLLSQKYQNWECLIVDGLSTDRTLEIIDDYEKKDDRIRHISETDDGIYDAFNKGWQLAKGEWVYYLGSDDSLIEEGLFLHMQFADNADENVGVLNGGVIRVTKDGKHRIMMYKGYCGGHQGMVMRKSAIRELGGFDLKYKYLADFDLFIKMRDSHFDVINTNQVVAKFYAGGASERLSNIFVVYKEKFKILQKDKSCKYPLIVAIKGIVYTLLGKLKHGALYLFQNKWLHIKDV